MSLFPTYKQPNKGRKFIIKDVDMRYSFDSLREIAERIVGANFEEGDICYFQNSGVTRRKVLLMKNGIVYQLYWMKLKGEFIEIDHANGQLKHYIDFNE